MQLYEILVLMGVPSAVTGVLFWRFKAWINKKDAEKEKREQNIEKLMLMIMQNGRATKVLAEATARAVQRIPDAHCNGDMEAALEKASKIQREEQDFLINHGIQNILKN